LIQGNPNVNKFHLVTAASLLFANIAQADDGKQGFYGGLQTSYSKAEVANINLDGIEGVGVFGGYGTAIGNWYVGGEISASYAKLHGSYLGFGAKLTKQYDLGAVARIGYFVTPNFLAYTNVGVEHAKFDIDVAGQNFTGKPTGIRTGVGAEVFVTDATSIRMEINYIDWRGVNAREMRPSLGLAFHF
jgi:opacity protein-like surface antigen